MKQTGRVTLASLALATLMAGNAYAGNWGVKNTTYCGGNTFSTCFSVNLSWNNDSGTNTVVTLVMSNTQAQTGLKWFSVGLDNMPAGLTYSGSGDLGFAGPGNGHSGGMFPPTVYAMGVSGGADPGVNVNRTFTFNFSGASSGTNWNTVLNAAGVGLHAGGLNDANGNSCSTKVSARNGTATQADGSSPGCESITTISSVPEPATMLLLATGLVAMGGAGFIRRRRKV